MQLQLEESAPKVLVWNVLLSTEKNKIFKKMLFLSSLAEIVLFVEAVLFATKQIVIHESQVHFRAGTFFKASLRWKEQMCRILLYVDKFLNKKHCIGLTLLTHVQINSMRAKFVVCPFVWAVQIYKHWPRRHQNT